MIKAKFQTKDNHFVSYHIHGHANFAEHGKDIVCAAVSGLYIAVTNYLIAHEDAASDSIGVIHAGNVMGSQIPIAILYEGLTDIEKEYPDNITVEVEVYE